jgi:hypothetical protein
MTMKIFFISTFIGGFLKAWLDQLCNHITSYIHNSYAGVSEVLIEPFARDLGRDFISHGRKLLQRRVVGIRVKPLIS